MSWKRLLGDHGARDLAAGVTVAAMLVPQSMAYAFLAGLPPQVGLYASTVPLLLYALAGSSRQLAVGPVAIVSLLTASAIEVVADRGVDPLAVAALLALLVGAVHLLLAGLRLGFLVRLLSHPVLVGFTAAASLIIGASQLRHVMGVSVPRTDHFHDTVLELVRAAPDVHGTTLAVGVGTIGLLLAVRRWARPVPGALVAVVVTTVASVALDLEDRGVAIVGAIPRGLPPLRLPDDWGIAGALLPAAFVITLVGYLESVAVGKVYARRHGYELPPDRELIGLGLANLGSGLVGGYPVSGGFGRSAVNADAGATTKRAGVVTAVLMALVLVALTPVFRHLPTAALGAIVIVAVSGLFDVAEMQRVRRIKPADGWTLAVSFVATLVLGVELGIAVAAASSVALIVARMMAPHTAVLGWVSEAGVFRNVERFPEALQLDGTLIVRFDVSLSYLNVDFMKRRIRQLVGGREDLRVLILDGSGMNDIDASAAEALADLVDELDRKGVMVHLAGVKGPVRDVLCRTGLYGSLGDRVHHEVEDAAEALDLAVE